LLLAKVIPTRKAFNLALPQAATGLLTILVYCTTCTRACSSLQLHVAAHSPLCSEFAV